MEGFMSGDMGLDETIIFYSEVTRRLHVKKTVLLFSKINWYDFVSGSLIFRYYWVGVSEQIF